MIWHETSVSETLNEDKPSMYPTAARFHRDKRQ